MGRQHHFCITVQNNYKSNQWTNIFSFGSILENLTHDKETQLLVFSDQTRWIV